jgi:hypothetical protein
MPPKKSNVCLKKIKLPSRDWLEKKPQIKLQISIFQPHLPIAWPGYKFDKGRQKNISNNIGRV